MKKKSKKLFESAFYSKKKKSVCFRFCPTNHGDVNGKIENGSSGDFPLSVYNLLTVQMEVFHLSVC
jgi:hypothetical protein